MLILVPLQKIFNVSFAMLVVVFTGKKVVFTGFFVSLFLVGFT